MVSGQELQKLENQRFKKLQVVEVTCSMKSKVEDGKEVEGDDEDYGMYFLD